ncbi:DUF58 domain-containing protein [Saccharothrix texasensis]|uniref:Uncharacterized protein (DUF58 family) n=1 Tax=Saccharothrix texasensis TaxID=103734 RepID=A0A3N1H1F8_9PSEU|nr:DUF58 domain-containing protein [Saccharothrix texasensis]ROP36102.1 uncharacterized protein (DUF58 family) [Saccharothrix texasensis]
MTGVRLTARGSGAVLLGVPLAGLGLWWRYPGVAGLGLALVLLVAVGVVSVLSRAQVAPKRTVRPRTVQRLGACTGVVELTGTSRRFPVVFDATDEVAGEAVPVDIPLLAPGQNVKVEYPIPTHARGLLKVGPLTLSRRGLAGLARARTVVGDVVEVRVVPRVLPVRGLPGGVRRGHVGAEERVERGGTDLVGLREYVPGDDLRRLHWATSARTGTLMIREDADPARPHLAVVLDDHVDGYGETKDLEDAVEVAASLVTVAIAEGHPVRLVSTSGAVDVELPAGAVDADASVVLAALADLRAADGGGAVRSLPIRDLDVVAVVCGARADLSALALEAGRASVGVVLVVDPEVTQPISAVGPVLLLRHAKAEGLLDAWNTAVSR